MHLHFSARYFSFLQFTFDKFDWNTATSSSLYVVYACFHTTRMDLTPWNRNYVTYTICSLVLYKKVCYPYFTMSRSSFIWVPSLYLNSPPLHFDHGQITSLFPNCIPFIAFTCLIFKGKQALEKIISSLLCCEKWLIRIKIVLILGREKTVLKKNLWPYLILQTTQTFSCIFAYLKYNRWIQ